MGGVVRRYPALYLPIARLRGKAVPFSARTELVIEGFPRSANTFAVTAFGSAQASPVHVARHEHAAAQVIAAARAGIPALVLIRRPEDAVSSFVVQQPDISMRGALDAYARFYAPLVRYRDRFVLATFEEVTTDYGEVVRRVNRAFGTRFDVFEHTDRNVRACLDAIEGHARSRHGDEGRVIRRASVPNAERTELKNRLRVEYRSPRLTSRAHRAETLYAALVSARAT